MKKGAKKFIYNFIKCEGITATIAGIVILIIFLSTCHDSKRTKTKTKTKQKKTNQKY